MFLSYLSIEISFFSNKTCWRFESVSLFRLPDLSSVTRFSPFGLIFIIFGNHFLLGWLIISGNTAIVRLAETSLKRRSWFFAVFEFSSFSRIFSAIKICCVNQKFGGFVAGNVRSSWISCSLGRGTRPQNAAPHPQQIHGSFGYQQSPAVTSR